MRDVEAKLMNLHRKSLTKAVRDFEERVTRDVQEKLSEVEVRERSAGEGNLRAVEERLDMRMRRLGTGLENLRFDLDQVNHKKNELDAKFVGLLETSVSGRLPSPSPLYEAQEAMEDKYWEGRDREKSG
jgi:hypothetical protein